MRRQLRKVPRLVLDVLSNVPVGLQLVHIRDDATLLGDLRDLNSVGRTSVTVEHDSQAVLQVLLRLVLRHILPNINKEEEGECCAPHKPK